MVSGPVKRPYESSLRVEQAASTRRRIIDAARSEFLDNGYGSVSMASIAKAAGVSREAIYKTFGSKSILMKAVYDVAVAGDHEPVAILERPHTKRIRSDPDPRAAIAAFAALSTELVGRLGPLMALVMSGARSGDEDLRSLAETSARERMIGVEAFVRSFAKHGLRDGVTVRDAVDVVWMLTSPEAWQMLVEERSWDLARYRDWLERSICDAVLPAN